MSGDLITSEDMATIEGEEYKENEYIKKPEKVALLPVTVELIDPFEMGENKKIIKEVLFSRLPKARHVFPLLVGHAIDFGKYAGIISYMTKLPETILTSEKYMSARDFLRLIPVADRFL